MKSTRIEIGPQNGAPPSLEFVCVDRLTVDPAYQRATDGSHSQRIIAGMLRRWDWSLCLPLVVSRRDDGRMMILDGQHRHTGAVRRGDIAHLPCVVLSGINLAGEARTFVDLNTRRQRLSQVDIFNGMLAAGDENAKATAQMIAQAGWRIVRSSSTDSWKPGDLHCAPTIADQRRICGPVPVKAALEILRAAYPDTVVTCTVRMLLPLIAIARAGLDPEARRKLTVALGSAEPNQWMLKGAQKQLADPELSRHAAVAAALVEAAAGVAAPTPKAPPRPARPIPSRSTSAPASQPADRTFDPSDKGWCDQCEELVSRNRAAACKSTFCKMKAAA